MAGSGGGEPDQGTPLGNGCKKSRIIKGTRKKACAKKGVKKGLARGTKGLKPREKERSLRGTV